METVLQELLLLVLLLLEHLLLHLLLLQLLLLLLVLQHLLLLVDKLTIRLGRTKTRGEAAASSSRSWSMASLRLVRGSRRPSSASLGGELALVASCPRISTPVVASSRLHIGQARLLRPG